MRSHQYLAVTTRHWRPLFPIVELVGNGDGTLALGRIQMCATLGQLLQVRRSLAADRLVIDGPCKTNGILLLNPAQGWDFRHANPGYRLAEQHLGRMGVGLFWTTLATLQHFDGASPGPCTYSLSPNWQITRPVWRRIRTACL
jgi:hypothetical protein